jgi:hypothetical protein
VTCGIMTNSTVVCIGTSTAATGYPSTLTATSLSCGNGICCALLVNSSIQCWGDNSHSECLVPLPNVNFTSVYTTSVAVCAIRQPTGLVICWGASSSYASLISQWNTTSMTSSHDYQLGMLVLLF